MGHLEEALALYATFEQYSAYDLIYAAPAHLKRAAIHERLGNVEQAVEHSHRFLDLWGDCDPGLRPLLEEAESRLARLDASNE
jgi:hypothetical protein